MAKAPPPHQRKPAPPEQAPAETAPEQAPGPDTEHFAEMPSVAEPTPAERRARPGELCLQPGCVGLYRTTATHKDGPEKAPRRMRRRYMVCPVCQHVPAPEITRL